MDCSFVVAFFFMTLPQASGMPFWLTVWTRSSFLYWPHVSSELPSRLKHVIRFTCHERHIG